VCTTPFLWTSCRIPEMHDLTAGSPGHRGQDDGVLAITEPDHGSDWILFDSSETGRNPAVAPQVRALLDGDHYVIHGQKSSWVSNGLCQHAALWVSLDLPKGMEGGGVACIPWTSPGSPGQAINKMGQRALNQGEISSTTFGSLAT